MPFRPPETQVPGPSKVLIPRIEKPKPPPHKSGSSGKRVERACLSCRARKVKCNGAQPACGNCRSNGITCTYTSGRRDRLKRATEHNEALISLLKDVQGSVGTTEKKRIEEMLTGVIDDVADAAASLTKSPEKAKSPDMEGGETFVSAEVGSNENTDVMDEDINRNENSHATGFLGRTSEIQWMRRLNVDAEQAGARRSKDDGPFGPPGNSPEATTQRERARSIRRETFLSPPREATTSSFYLDDEIADLDFVVDPDELPPFDVAERLLNCYLSHVQDSFPILVKKSFVRHFYRYYASVGRNRPETLAPKWKATLNLVFAISSAHSHFIEAEWRGDERDHLVYYQRAWELALKDPWWFSLPDFSLLQLTGLLAFYYLTIGHINRSWAIVGFSLRFGYALGLHLRNEDRSTSLVKKEVLARMWWGLYSLESSVSVITGRPSVGLESHCSVPLPLPIAAEEIDEAIIISRFGIHPGNLHLGERRPTQSEPTNCGSYLKHAVKVGLILSNALAQIYSPRTAQQSWRAVQEIINDLMMQLEQWSTSLPYGLAFTRSAEDDNHAKERMTLQMYYHSAKILLTRPCLCRLDRRIGDHTRSSDEFNKRTAEVCVTTAKAVASLLPDDPDRNGTKIYKIGPWWSMVHYLTQALAVLLLEVSCRGADFPRDRQDVVPSLKKLLRWLRAMRMNNTMAVRAYDISFRLLKKLVTHINLDISDLLREHTEVEYSTYPAISASRQAASEARSPPAPHRRPSSQTQYSQSPWQFANAQPFESLNFQDPMDAGADYSMEGLEIQEPPSLTVPDTFHDYFTTAAAPFNPMLPNGFVTSYDELFPLPNAGVHRYGPEQDPGPSEQRGWS